MLDKTTALYDMMLYERIADIYDKTPNASVCVYSYI